MDENRNGPEFSPEFLARVAAFLEKVGEFNADAELLKTIFQPDQKGPACSTNCNSTNETK
jgi:hypothetical protein